MCPEKLGRQQAIILLAVSSPMLGSALKHTTQYIRRKILPDRFSCD
jgi:hypothetical protein